ncbi:MAG: polysaccharide deacetylase, partial [Oscillospiraceae bacterium]|nr:polysaccharide deacetylase [Oscillospiraceae bacterium]
GARSKDTESILRELGFKVSLSCTEVTSSVSKDPESLYFLGRFLRDNKESSEHLFERMLK